MVARAIAAELTRRQVELDIGGPGTTPPDPSALPALPDSWYGAVGAAPELGWALAVMRGSGAGGQA